MPRPRRHDDTASPALAGSPIWSHVRVLRHPRIPRFSRHFCPGFLTATIKLRYLRSLRVGVRYPIGARRVSARSPGCEQGGVLSAEDHGAAGGFMVSLTTGSRIAGYRLEERIGRGGMAVVFRARDERLDRPVALKILAPALAGDGEFQRRFVSESRAAAAIDDQDAGRLDVPVHQPGPVRRIQRRGHRGDEPRHPVRRQRALPVQHLAQVSAPDEPHRDEQHPAGRSDPLGNPRSTLLPRLRRRRPVQDFVRFTGQASSRRWTYPACRCLAAP